MVYFKYIKITNIEPSRLSFVMQRLFSVNSDEKMQKFIDVIHIKFTLNIFVMLSSQ